MDLSKKDKFWKITENKKEAILREIRHNEVDSETTRDIIKLSFPEMNDEDIYKIFVVALILNQYFNSDEDDEDDEDNDEIEDEE